jgi:hypothetical protein
MRARWLSCSWVLDSRCKKNLLLTDPLGWAASQRSQGSYRLKKGAFLITVILFSQEGGLKEQKIV